MLSFHVQDMSCGHCVRSITRALTAVDPRAVVECDLATHRVQVQADQADAQAFAQAIREAGYTPVAVASVPPPIRPARAVGSCGCGC